MKKIIFTILAAAAIVCSCNRSPKVDPVVKQYLKDSLEVLTERCQDVLDAAYMEGELLDTRNDIPGWEGYPVELWEYWTDEDIYLKAPKKGLVYMLNPEAEQLAKWIINAVWDATGALDAENIEKVRKFIKWQSGAQFPVSGVVYEAMYTEGFYEPYVFKDGVTVYVADSLMRAWDKTCTEEQLQYYLTLTNDQLEVNTGRYARISSTTREMYYNAGGEAEVGYSDDGRRDRAWLGEVARLYQEAWNSDHNFLIYAWAKYNL